MNRYLVYPEGYLMDFRRVIGDWQKNVDQDVIRIRTMTESHIAGEIVLDLSDEELESLRESAARIGWKSERQSSNRILFHMR